MSVTVRRYKRGGWEVDIRTVLPDGTTLRERRKAPVSSKSGAKRWGENRKRSRSFSGPVRKPPKSHRKQEGRCQHSRNSCRDSWTAMRGQTARSRVRSRERVRSSRASSPPARDEQTRFDHQRRCTADQEPPSRQSTGDREHRPHHVECDSESRSRMGGPRAFSLYHQASTSSPGRSRLPRFR